MLVDLKLAILKSGQSQRQIGVRTNIPEARLSSIVRGWVCPRNEERDALQRVLGISADAFEQVGQ
jgi:hypothetical protein